MDALESKVHILVIAQIVVHLVAEPDLRCSEVLANCCPRKPAGEALHGRLIEKVDACGVQREPHLESGPLAPRVTRIREVLRSVAE